MSTVRRLRVTHRTEYHYSSPVVASYNELRLTPQAAPGQNVLDSTVTVRPAVRLRSYTDYWGSHVHQFDLHHAHENLEIVAKSVVETGADTRPDVPISDGEWDEVYDAAFRDRFNEMLMPTLRTPYDERLAEVARNIRAEYSRTQAHLAVANWVRGSMTYQPGTTGVHTTAIEAWDAGNGVCQDFAHVALVLLRGIGIPSRYVSGYLLPIQSAEIGETVVGESHAWVEVWIDGAWVGYDPTNGKPVGVDHVLVATGRDYADVAPVIGIYAGGGNSTLEVSVEITRLR